MKIISDKKEIERVINSRYIENIFPSKEKLREFLNSGKKLRIYIGIDPTAPQLHLGHSTNFLLLKKFQRLGHEIILLIGDFTARIGDPTGRIVARKPLKKEEILRNCRDYKKQAGKILDFFTKQNPVKILFNSYWFSKFKLEELIQLTAKATVGQMIKREMFQRRIKEGKEIFLHEFLYPLFQGYDSVAIATDIEVGGNDQTFNMLLGRELEKEYLGREKIVIATKLLINPKTGRKLMSKSEGNFIALNDPPDQMYGKIMALPDEVILPMFELCTEIPDKEIKDLRKRLNKKEINPRDVKTKLAKEIVKIYHGKEKAKKAEEEFEEVFKKKKLPSKIAEVKIKRGKIELLDLLLKTKLVSSKSEAKRLISQRGVRIDGVLKENWREEIEIKEMIIKVGKRKFIKIIPR